MTSVIPYKQYKEMIERIKEEYPDWTEGDFSNIPINVSGFLDMDREEFIKIIQDALKDRYNYEIK